MISSRRLLAGFAAALLLGGCTTILGIDESFVAAEANEDGGHGGSGDGGDGGAGPRTDATTGSDGGSGSDATSGTDAQSGGDATSGDGSTTPAWTLDTTFAAGGQAALTDASVLGDPVSLVIDNADRVFVVGTGFGPDGGQRTAYWILAPDSGTQPPPQLTGLAHPTDAVLGDDGQVYVATTNSYEDEGVQGSASIEITGLDAAAGAQHSYTSGNTYVERITSVTTVGGDPVAHFYTSVGHATVVVTTLDINTGTPSSAYVVTGSDVTDIYGGVPIDSREVIVGANQNSSDQEVFGVVSSTTSKLTTSDLAATDGTGLQMSDIVALDGGGYVAVGVGNTNAGILDHYTFQVAFLGPLGSATSTATTETMEQQYPATPVKDLLAEPASHTRLVADQGSFLAAGVFDGDAFPTLVRFGADGRQDLTFGLVSPPQLDDGVAALGGMMIHQGLLYVAYSVTRSNSNGALWAVARYRRTGS
jgi:hypothetical protein